jgi:hypothetical protein
VKEYFDLQLKMTNRKLEEAGIGPLFGYLAMVLIFTAFSGYLFYKTEFAEPIYVAVALTLVGKLSEIRRNDFLKLCFGRNGQNKIRIAENLIMVLPFIIFLSCKFMLLSAMILTVAATLLSLLNFRATFNFVVPTPFHKRPFEFAMGFRNTFFLFLGAYGLTCIAVSVDNFNLGIFAMLFVFAFAMSYFNKPENEYFVWIYSLNARRFLLEKIKTAILYSTVLALPVAVILAIYYPQNFATVLTFLLIGWSFLTFMVVSKYASYPDEMNITQGVFLALSISFPPMLVALIPYLFNQSEKRLSSLLQ